MVFISGACSSESSNQEPSFSGPWGQDFELYYTATNDLTTKEILADGVISDAEINEVRDQQITCLENLGCIVEELNNDGSASIVLLHKNGENPSFDEATDRTNQLRDQCDAETDWSIISYLYTNTRNNPNNQDIYSLMAQCLVRVGLRPEGYTADDYRTEFESDAFLPYLDNQDTPEGIKFKACNLDPLHAQA